MSRLPRVQWVVPKWQPSGMGAIMEKNKRKMLQGRKIQPDMAQRTLRLRARQDKPGRIGQAGTVADRRNPEAEQVERQEDNKEGDNNADAPSGDDSNPTRRSMAKRSGPCHFGCTTTTNVRNGVQIWKAPPSPSPWPGVAKTASLCSKCYSKGIAAYEEY